MDLTPEERDLLVRTVIGEASNQPELGKAAVANVVLNRLNAGGYGDDLKGVLFKPKQFEPWGTRSRELMSYSPESKPYNEAAAAVEKVLSGKFEDPTKGATHFANVSTVKERGNTNALGWINGMSNVTQIGAHTFGNADAGRAKVAKKQEDDYSDLIKEFGSAPAPKPGDKDFALTIGGSKKSKAEDDYGDLIKEFGSAPTGAGTEQFGPELALDATTAAAKKAEGLTGTAQRTGVGFLRGIQDVADTAQRGLDVVVGNPLSHILPESMGGGEPMRERIATMRASNDLANSQFEAGLHDSTAASIGRVGGQIAATAPIMPSASLAKGANAMFNAAPKITAAGEKVAAPILNRLASGATQGAGAGAIFGAATGQSVGENALLGAAGVPVVMAAAKLGGLAVRGASNLVDKYQVQKIARAAGVEPSAARNVLQRLEEIGITPQEASQRLQGMGPKATLADLDPALTTEASGIAAQGGKATSILKNAFGERAASADDRITNVINKELGPAPDAQNILNRIRQRQTMMETKPADIQDALGQTIGNAHDPKSVLDAIVTARSKISEPLYDKAMKNPVEWDGRLQQFLSDPLIKSGLKKGVENQRLEALAANKEFNPSDYAIKAFAEDGSPILDKIPNMRTLNVVKKGLDRMIEDSRDAVTGRLSEEGRAISKVQKAFVEKLDNINSDYKAARDAWRGPTETHEAFRKGMTVFDGAGGMKALENSPTQLTNYMKTASASEKEALKAGMRASIEQKLTNTSDPVKKAQAFADVQANVDKIASVIGKPEADRLVNSIKYKYTDPVGDAFTRGIDVFKAKQGIAGIENSPQALKDWVKTANPGEVEAARNGARTALEQVVSDARQGELSAVRSMFSKASGNRAKLEALFPNSPKMLDDLQHLLNERATERAITQGSQTAERLAVGKRYAPAGPGNFAGNALTSGAADIAMGAPGLMTAANVARNASGGFLSGLRERSANKLATGTADLLSRQQATGRGNALNALQSIPRRNLAPSAVNNIAGLPLVAPAGQAMYSGYEQARTDVNRLIKGR